MFRNIISCYLLTLIALAGCTHWNRSALHRPIPVEFQPSRTANPTSITAETARSVEPTSSVTKANASAPTELPAAKNAFRNEYQLTPWPDQPYWDKVYAEINEADTRKPDFSASRKNAMLYPLKPMQRSSRVEAETTFMEWLATLKDVASSTPAPPASSTGTNRDNSMPVESTATPAVQLPEAAELPTPSASMAAAPVENTPPSVSDSSSPQESVEVTPQNTEAATAESLASDGSNLPAEQLGTESVNTFETRTTTSAFPGLEGIMVSMINLQHMAKNGVTISQTMQQEPNLLQGRPTVNTDLSEPESLPAATPWDRDVRPASHEVLAQGESIPDDATFRHAEGGPGATASGESSAADLQVNNATFCYEVNGFGQYRTWSSNRFSVGQPVLVYCELDNHTSVPETRDGNVVFVTRLKNSIAVYDDEERLVQQIDFPEVEDVARSRRRDFYLYLSMHVGELPAGSYRAYLTVTDTNGRETATTNEPMVLIVR